MNSGNHAQVLIEALENLIIPIITSHCPPSEGLNFAKVHGARNRSSLVPEAQQLLAALKQFVTALMKPSTPQADSTVVPHDRSLVRVPTCVAVDAVYRPRKPPLLNHHWKPFLLQRVLDDMHRKVFNQMPIRLLTFNLDGSGIRLIERGELWQIISSTIKRDYDEDKLKAEIRRLELEETQRKNNNLPATGTRALESHEARAIRNMLARYGQYAILSHTWLQGTNGGEVTYSSWKNGTFDKNLPGYRKLIKFCEVAATEHNLTIGWMDTICINKESSSELDESIRSMYNWYLRSHVCITHLSDTIELPHMWRDTWFTRGWTLQELLAPRVLKFYNTNWKVLVPGIENDKADNGIISVIQAATGITTEELDRQLFKIPISRRMQWAAVRKVTREEDASYSLMGIFGVSFSIAYGEGSIRALFRLSQAIMNSRVGGLLDITNWGFGPDIAATVPIDPGVQSPSFILPLSLRQYTWRQPVDIKWYPSTKPVALTHLGLHVSVLLMPGIRTDLLAPRPSVAFGNYHANVTGVEFHFPDKKTSGPRNYAVLDQSIFKSSQSSAAAKSDVIFGVLNFSENSTSVQLPHGGILFAVVLLAKPAFVGGFPESEDTVYEPRVVKNAVAFKLKAKENVSWVVQKDNLREHGMTLRTMYL